jgi:hypothetical protein
MHVVVALLVIVIAGCATPDATRSKPSVGRIEHILVIYAENRSFDNLYGLFPGANGIANATPAQYTQVDNDGKPLPHLPPVWKGRDPSPAFRDHCPNACSDRCAADQPAAIGARARSGAQVLPEPDQINGRRNVVSLPPIQRAGWLLRRIKAADVALGGIHTGRQFLHGRVAIRS